MNAIEAKSTPPPTQNVPGRSVEHVRTLIHLAQHADGAEQAALLAGAHAICRKHLHRVRNKESRRLRGLPPVEYVTPPEVVALVNPPMEAKQEGAE